MELWQRAAGAQGAVDPAFARQWKGFLDQWIEAWSKGLAQAMGTEAFAQALGRYLDQTLTLAGPMKKAVDQQTDAGLRALGHDAREAPPWDDTMGHAHLIVTRDQGGYLAASDPRSEGLALGW